MKALSSLAIVALLLVGCKGSVTITCPSLVQYSPEFQKAALAELDAIKAPHLEALLADYGILRDAVRACLKRRDAKTPSR